MSKYSVFPIGAFLLPLMAGVAAAEKPNAPPVDSRDEACKAEPNAQSDEKTADTEHLSALLDRCDGVLEPPAVGDKDLIEPSPPTGDTPVIKPDELPHDGSGTK